MAAGEEGGWVETVRGPVEADRIGRTLIHEHLHIDLRPVLAEHGYSGAGDVPFESVAAEARWNPGIHESNYDLTDIDLVCEELARVLPHRITCVVDATPADLGRDPLVLRQLSERLDLHVVMGAGWYLEASHRRHIDGWTTDHLIRRLVDECSTGVGDTGIRPGIIGEIGTNDPASDSEMTVVRAAAQAGAETGRAVSIHLHPWGSEGHDVLDAALGAGIGIDRVLLNHMTTAVTDMAYLRSILDRGANVAFDLFGFDHSLLGEGRYAPSDWDVVRAMAVLVDAGHVAQLFMSQDIGVRTRLHRYGGWGYDHLATHVVPLMARMGIGESDIETILAGNPRRLLTLDEPRASDQGGTR